MMARYIVADQDVPKVALLGITTRAGENDLFYRDDASVTAFSAVVEGCDRPTSEVWTGGRERACEKSQDDLVFRFRNGGGQIEWARAGYQLQTSLQLDQGSRLRADGMILHPGVDAEEAQAISDERMERGFPGFPRNDDEATEEFAETVEELEGAGVTVVAFEVPYTPVHQDNLEDAGRDYDAKRQEVARVLAASANVPLFPVERFGPWWGDGDSRDAIHLSPQGAGSFTKQLNAIPGFNAEISKALDEPDG